jgi:signal transduction histidine kinase/HAMP domain-containing protein
VAHPPRGIGSAVNKFSLGRLNIRPRLTLGFAFIILAMLAGNAVLLWQFDRARAQAERLSRVDQKFIAVLQAHLNLVSFHERLNALAHSDNIPLRVSELEAVHHEVVEGSRRSKDALSRLPVETQSDATSLPTLIAIQDILPAQLEAVTALAESSDWAAVRLRLTNQVGPLQALSSSLVEALDREVGDERSQIIANIGGAQRRILLIVPVTAGIMLVFAAFFGTAITRSITRPLSRLMDASKALGRSEFHHRVSIAGRDELARLGQVFNETAATLRDLYQELFTREAYLAEAQRLSHTGSFGWNLSDGGELVWSDETFRIFDYERSVNPTLELVLQRTHPDDVALVRQLIDRVSHGGTEWDLEHRLLTPDGSIKHVRAVAHAVRDPSGQLRFFGAVVDLTASKRAEEALNKARADLAHVSRVTTMSALTASIAHEVNQPLAGIITNAGTCLRMLDATPANIEGARETARRTIRDGNRAADVITRLRALFSKREFTLEPLDLNEATREVIALSSNDLHRNRVVLQSDLSSDLPMISGDRIQLQQVILNLLRNASDAMVDVHDRPRQLQIRTEREGDRVRLTVRDAGIGLPAQSMDSLFDAFYTTKSGGMGIGLFVSRSIVERHQGRLWAEPNDGPGATVSFSVPSGHAGVGATAHALGTA